MLRLNANNTDSSLLISGRMKVCKSAIQTANSSTPFRDISSLCGSGRHHERVRFKHTHRLHSQNCIFSIFCFVFWRVGKANRKMDVSMCHAVLLKSRWFGRKNKPSAQKEYILHLIFRIFPSIQFVWLTDERARTNALVNIPPKYRISLTSLKYGGKVISRTGTILSCEHLF